MINITLNLEEPNVQLNIQQLQNVVIMMKALIMFALRAKMNLVLLSTQMYVLLLLIQQKVIVHYII